VTNRDIFTWQHTFNFPSYLYPMLSFLLIAFLFLFLFLSPSPSLSLFHSSFFAFHSFHHYLRLIQDFSRWLKFMLSRVWCVGIAFRLARCSFCAGLRIHATLALHICAYTRTHIRREIPYPWFLSRSLSFSQCAFFPPRPEFDKFICLCGAIEPCLAIIAVGKLYEEKMR